MYADLAPPPAFRRDLSDTTGAEWSRWKRQFEEYLVAKGLDGADGKRKVNILLHLLGEDGIKLYSTFEFAQDVAADASINRAAIQAESNEDLKTLLRKFDEHIGNTKY